MKKSLLWVIILVMSALMIAAFSLYGCKAGEAASEEEAVEEAPAEEVVEAEEAEPAAETTGEVISELQYPELPDWCKVLPISEVKTRGYHGEMPVWYTDITITPEQVEEVKSLNLKAAFLTWQEGDYCQSIKNGVTDALNALGACPKIINYI